MKRGALLLVAGLAACGGEEVLVPVTLNLESATCSTDFPDQVSLACDSAVGAWVKSGDELEPDTLDEACVDFASNGKTLADLPEVLSASVDLSGLGAGEAWLEIAVFGSSSAADGCPQIGDLDGDMVAYGRTRAAALESASRGLTLELFCFAVDDGTTPAACMTRCEEVYAYCPDAAESGPCDLDYDDCITACPVDDEACLAVCDADYDTCLDDQPIPCDDALTICLDDCAGDLTCEDACFADYDSCVVANCETSHSICLARCDSLEGSCASVM